ETIRAPILVACWQNLLQHLVAAQYGTYPGKQLARAERLGDVVVGPKLEAHHPVGLLFATGHHDDRNRGHAAHLLCEHHAILAHEAEIENDGVYGLLGEHARHLVTGGDRRDAKVVLAEIIGDQMSHRGVVVDGEHVGRDVGAHGGQNAVTSIAVAS